MGIVNQDTLKINDSILRGEHETSAWNDYNVPVQSLSRGNVSPDDEIIIGNIKGVAFDGATNVEEVFGVFELLHGYREGTDLRPHIHIITSSTLVGDIKFQLEYTISYVDGTYSTSNTTSAVISTNGIDRQHLTEEFGVIDGTGLLIGTQIHFRLFRDPTDIQDTYTDDAFVSTVGVHVQLDGDGSRGVFQKL